MQGVHRLQGERVGFSREPFVEHHAALRHPLRNQSLGRLRHIVEDDLAMHLIADVQDGREQSHWVTPTVVAQRVEYEDESANVMVVRGLVGGSVVVTLADGLMAEREDGAEAADAPDADAGAGAAPLGDSMSV